MAGYLSYTSTTYLICHLKNLPPQMHGSVLAGKMYGEAFAVLHKSKMEGPPSMYGKK